MCCCPARSLALSWPIDAHLPGKCHPRVWQGRAEFTQKSGHVGLPGTGKKLQGLLLRGQGEGVLSCPFQGDLEGL